MIISFHYDFFIMISLLLSFHKIVFFTSSQIAVHHSATHILHSVLGSLSFPPSQQSQQSQPSPTLTSLQTGSHITPTSFSFDFYAGLLSDHMQDVPSFIQTVEDKVNQIALTDRPVTWTFYPRETLREMKGKVIGDVASLSRKEGGIRGVEMDGISHEFCCGK